MNYYTPSQGKRIKIEIYKDYSRHCDPPGCSEKVPERVRLIQITFPEVQQSLSEAAVVHKGWGSGWQWMKRSASPQNDSKKDTFGKMEQKSQTIREKLYLCLKPSLHFYYNKLHKTCDTSCDAKCMLMNPVKRV